MIPTAELAAKRTKEKNAKINAETVARITDLATTAISSAINNGRFVATVRLQAEWASIEENKAAEHIKDLGYKVSKILNGSHLEIRWDHA